MRHINRGRLCANYEPVFISRWRRRRVIGIILVEDLKVLELLA